MTVAQKLGLHFGNAGTIENFMIVVSRIMHGKID